MTTIDAVYENGVLRPLGPVPLAEGQTVRVTVADTIPHSPSLPETTSEYAARLAAAETIEDVIAVMNSAPPEPGVGDLCREMNEARRIVGRPLVYPDLDDEEPPPLGPMRSPTPQELLVMK